MRYAIVIALMFVASLPSTASAQSAAPPTQQDLLIELLAEVRGLRQSMERAATVGARIQLLVARVQLQEQRIAELSRRITAVRDEITQIDQQAGAIVPQLAMLEKTFGSDAVPPDERNQFDEMLKGVKNQAAALEKRKQDLANEENLLMQQVAADQNRWSDVNAQLDDLERTLAVPVKK